ncbi:MAG: glycoside hydrolase family 113 [bacterium]
MKLPAIPPTARRWPWLLVVTFLLLSLGLFATPGFEARRSNEPQITRPPSPSREELRRSLFQQQRLHVVYSGAGEIVRQRYQQYFQTAPSRRFKISVFADRDYPRDSLGCAPLRIVGAFSSNRALQSLLSQLPITKINKGFVFASQAYRDSTALLHLFYPNPRNSAMPVWITTGINDAVVLDYLEKSGARFGDIGDYWVSTRGQMQVIGFFQDRGPQAWRTEAAQEMSLAAEHKTAAKTKNFVLITHGAAFDHDEIEAFAEQEEVNLAAMLQRLQMPESRLERSLPLRVHLWDSFEKKALFTRNAGLRHCDLARREAHLVWTKSVRGDDFFAEAQWFIEQLLPKTSSTALHEGLAVALTKQWRGTGFAGWTSRLLSTGNASVIEELFDPEVWRAESPLTRQPLLGSLVNFFLEYYNAGEFEAVYQSWPEKGVLQSFPRGESWESVRNLCYEKVIQTPPLALRRPRPPAVSVQDFHRGFCYAHEGYQVYDGYMGHRSRESLKQLGKLGVDAISVTPFGYLQSPQQPEFLRHSDGLGSENDESLLASLQFAKELGMRVMLKPHMWVGGSSYGWPGDLHLDSMQEWRSFFAGYERWMRHYAMLAEIYGFDSLCLGVELVHATRGNEALWRELIFRLRGLYSGPMVYAANWGEEFERLSLWSNLDAIAINCYYPLSQKENASAAELLAGANDIADKIATVAQKYQKPVLITEIGFCSRPGAWVQPHRDDRSAPVHEECQRRSYEAIYKAFSHRTWLAGIYWWKWPTDLDDGGSEDNQFTPNGKAAAQVVAQWYKSRDHLSVPATHE